MKAGALAVGFGVLMVVAAVLHFAAPGIFTPFFAGSPFGLPIIYASGVVEIGVGLATVLPRTRRWGAAGILVLMVCFLPLHVLDVFAEHPAVGSHTAALVRLPLQLVLIGWAWAIRGRGARGSGS